MLSRYSQRNSLHSAVLSFNFERECTNKLYKSNILRSSGVPKDSDAFFECSNVPFPILFIFPDLNNNLSNCHKQESHTFWNLFFLQCQLTFGRPKINLTVARVCLKICKDLFASKKIQPPWIDFHTFLGLNAKHQ